MKRAALVLAWLWCVLPLVAQPAYDTQQLIEDLRVLSTDDMAGRRVATEGSAKARAYLLAAYERLGLQPVGGSYTHDFSFISRRDSSTYAGVNVLGWIPGTARPDVYIVLTAHYDHLGTRDEAIYNGADDNASGTAGLLAAAAHFKANPPQHSLIFAALDAEELGLQGATAFVTNSPVPLEQIALNINLDMISRADKGELYAVGTYHYPYLKPYLETVAARSEIKLLFGHDTPGLPPGQNWTFSSDHGPFHRVRIPFVYFGVEDHPDYHQPSDVFENIKPAVFIQSVNTILDAVGELDQHLGAIQAATKAAADQ